jgi:hypothetical protein
MSNNPFESNLDQGNEQKLRYNATGTGILFLQSCQNYISVTLLVIHL